MTFTIKLPGTLASSANLPVQRDYVADLANDSRCVGVWRLNTDYATLSGSDVTEFANLKTGGPAMTSTSYRGTLTTDNVIGRDCLVTTNGDPVEYSIDADLSGYTGITMCWNGRALNTVSGQNNRLLYSDGADAIYLNGLLTGGNYQMRQFLGTDVATINLTGDPHRLLKVRCHYDSSDDISNHVSDETTATTTTTETVQTTTKFYIGSATGSIAPDMAADCVALFSADLNLAANADLLAIYNQFLSEIYRT